MAEQSHHSVVRAAGVVSAAVMLSRVTGLIREIAFARLFGAGLANDAFIIGFRIPNLARDLFAEGALSSAFVPTFTSYLATKGKQEAAHLSNLVATALIEQRRNLTQRALRISHRFSPRDVRPSHKI